MPDVKDDAPREQASANDKSSGEEQQSANLLATYWDSTANLFAGGGFVGLVATLMAVGKGMYDGDVYVSISIGCTRLVGGTALVTLGQ